MADVITGTSGNDVIQAHSGGGAGGSLVLVLAGSFADGGVGPTVDVWVNGVPVRTNIAVTASEAAGASQTVTIPVSGAVSSVAIAYTNDTQTQGSYADGEDRNLYLKSVSLNGTLLDPSTASYARTQNGAHYDTMQGQADMVWGGTMSWSGAVVQNAAPGGGSGSVVIDGLAGIDTVAYAGRATDYSLSFSGGGQINISSKSGATGPDTLNNVERVLFDDAGQGSVSGRTVDGGSGLDTLVLNGALSAYGISGNGSGTFTVNSGAQGTDTLVNVERLVFSDFNVALDVNGNGGMAYRLYQAAFNRAPDAPGLGFQMKALDDGWGIAAVARNFIDSPEFSATYGSLNTEQFVTQLYQNVLHRAPDQAGLQFHVNNLNNGLTRADVLAQFSESPENQAALIGIIQHGMVYIA